MVSSLIFGIYLGKEADGSVWAECAAGFAGWAGLTFQAEHQSVPDGRAVCLAVMEHPAVSRANTIRVVGDLLLLGSCHDASPGQLKEEEGNVWKQIEQPPRRNGVRVAVRLSSGELRASVPMATPEQVFYCDDERGLAVGNDMRLVARWAGGSVSPAALYALFQYGMIPAPLSMSNRVARVPPGHLLKVRPGRESMTVETIPWSISGLKGQTGGADSETELVEALDTQLRQTPEAAVLYFSGGVDSSLLASRLKRIGRSDIGLVNFAFGPEDLEGRLALEIAAHLGLHCEQLIFEPGELTSLLARVGRDYSYPFADDSTIPTNLLVHASVKAFGPGRTILEGTGADGGFGPVVRRPELWQCLYAAPQLIRRFFGEGYKWLRLWEQDPHVPKARMLLSLARQTARMPFEVAAVLSQNALDGIAYSIPPDVRESLTEAVTDPLRLWARDLSRGERFALLDLIHVCAGRFAAKSFDPLRQAGMNPVYPFLEPGLLRVSFRLPWNEKVQGGEGKALLKRLVARDIPPDSVYRRKSAFDAPLNAVLSRADVHDFFDGVVLSSRNLVLDYLDVRVVKRLIERGRESKPLEMNVLRFLWTLLFVSAWLSGVNAFPMRRVDVSVGGRR
jgi:asparagine synthetase B (glutamine-hydrolysing)